MQKFLSTAAALFLCLAPAHAAVPNLSFTVNLNEPVIVDTAGGTPSISLDIGGITRLATYVSGSTTSSLTFTYTPQAGDIDLDGIQITPAQINPNGGTIRDVAGNAAILTFTAPDTSGIKLNYPSLSLDFIADADGRYTMNGTSYDTLPAFLTATGGSFTRASTATYYDSTGTLQTAASGAPRFDYDPVTHVAKGLLLEESRTNSATYSESIGAWSKLISGSGSLPIVTTNYGIAPDGANTAERVQFNRGAGNATTDYSLVSIGATFGSASVTSKSLWIKSNTGLTQTVVFYDAQGNIGATFAATTDWTRITLGPNNSATTATIVIGTRGGTGFYFTGGDQSLDILIWGGQIEVGSFVTSYIPTTTTAVTRARDILAFPTSSWFSSTAGLLSTEAELNSDIASLHVFAALNGAGSYGAGRGFLVRSSSASQYAAGGNCCSAALNIVHATGTTLKVAGGYSGTTTVIASNNTSTTTTNNDFTGSGTTQLILGDLQTSSSWQSIGAGHISKFRYYPSLPATTQIQLLTQ